jgi:hypothetical protein
MAVPRKYQFSDLVKRRLRALLGTLAIAMTSLKQMTWTAVMITMMYRWPAPRAKKKPPIMTRVHVVRTMKLAFFFSYSLCSGTGGAWRRQRGPSPIASMHTDVFSMAPLRVGLPGCEPVSEMSDMLIEARRARPLLALLCANLTSLRGRAIVCWMLCAVCCCVRMRREN